MIYGGQFAREILSFSSMIRGSIDLIFRRAFAKKKKKRKRKKKKKGKRKKRIDGRINRSIGSGDDRRSQDPRRDAKRVDISILIAVTFAQVMEQREVYTTIKVCSWEKWYMLISDDT